MNDVSTLPYPIASLYDEMQAETQPGVRFRSLVRCFAGFLKFISLIAVSDYLLGDYNDPTIDELLSGEKLKRPSLGHWNEFLREILKFHLRNGTRPRIPEFSIFTSHLERLPNRRAMWRRSTS